MSPKKLAATLAAILRDLEPWPRPDRDHQWGGPHVELSREQVKALPPYSIFLALVTFSKFPYFGRAEKIAWTIPVRFKGVAYLISFQKFGLRIHPANPKETTPELEAALIDRLLHAIRISDGLIKPFAEAQVRAGRVTIINDGGIYLGKYNFFREKARECYESAAIKEGEDAIRAINRKLQMDREGFYYSSAALEGYFSYLEKLLVLLLPFCDFDPAKDNLIEFITSFWTEKFKRIFDVGGDKDAERVYRSLKQIKEKFRNPLSHGGLDQDAATFCFHVPGVGAVPMSLSHFAESIQFGLNPIEEVSFREVCDILDQVDEFFANGPKRLAVRCVMSGINVIFSQESVERYKKALESDESVERFIDYQLGQMDDAVNMDW
jgi:hypothetical protein